MNAVNTCGMATVFLCVYVLASAGVKPITMKVSRMQGFEPMTTQVEIRIPRRAENRQACVSLMGPKEYPLACWDLDIGSAPIFTRTWSDLPAGGYRAQAYLRRTDGSFYSNVILLRVAGEEL